MFYDALVFDAPTLAPSGRDCSATRQVMLGTDYPFAFHDHTPATPTCATPFADRWQSRDRLLFGQRAVGFLGLDGNARRPMTDFLGLRAAQRRSCGARPRNAAKRVLHDDVWGLELTAGVSPGGAYGCMATGADDDHVLALHAGEHAPAIRSITFRVPSRVDGAATPSPSAEWCRTAGGIVLSAVGKPLPGLAEESALAIVDPQGRIAAVRAWRHAAGSPDAPARDRPERLSHVNINSRDTDATSRVLRTRAWIPADRPQRS